ncbi:hypothetical protein IQ216_02685 [Cyanobium sp. LEGE 06143]|uniref:hypothetical protein n=1 Tax=Cyanobium sp. LEGE 06143 TaxID=945727 RepID=UPI001881A7FA|nr:hypothetical protein [Cyanobium sp. LEGE 06143]MBE9172025.1 hypothetical protein [Cyanobium sp. LEGE 06143]
MTALAAGGQVQVNDILESRVVSKVQLRMRPLSKVGGGALGFYFSGSHCVKSR